MKNPNKQFSIDQLIAMELKNIKECIVEHYKHNNIKKNEKDDNNYNNISISCCFAFPSYYDSKTISKFKLLCKIFSIYFIIIFI